MSVPTTFMTKYNPEQFEIIGSSIALANKPTFEIPKNKQGGPAFYLRDENGELKRIFARLVVKNLQPRKIEED